MPPYFPRSSSEKMGSKKYGNVAATAVTVAAAAAADILLK